MARTINEQEYAEKRNGILNAAQKIIFTKGYEQMTIQDILAELEISSGAFYHYFDSKPAVLEAFIQRIKEVTEQPLLPIIEDPNLSAIQKLQGFFDTLDNLRITNKANVVKLGSIWYTDANAIVRQKVDEAILRQRAPLLTRIVHQGVQEGVFTTPNPDQSGEVILSLVQGMGNTHAQLLFSPDRDLNEAPLSQKIIAVYDAYIDAIERVLGAPHASLRQTIEEAVEVWIDALKDTA